MDEKKFVAFLFRVMLEEYFGTKSQMARELDVQLRTLQIAFKKLDSAKGGSVAFERLILYCCKHNINILELYDRYIGKAALSHPPFVLREEPAWLMPCYPCWGQDNIASQGIIFVNSLKGLVARLFSENCDQCRWRRGLDGTKQNCGIANLIQYVTELSRSEATMQNIQV